MQYCFLDSERFIGTFGTFCLNNCLLLYIFAESLKIDFI